MPCISTKNYHDVLGKSVSYCHQSFNHEVLRSLCCNKLTIEKRKEKEFLWQSFKGQKSLLLSSMGNFLNYSSRPQSFNITKVKMQLKHQGQVQTWLYSIYILWNVTWKRKLRIILYCEGAMHGKLKEFVPLTSARFFEIFHATKRINMS